MKRSKACFVTMVAACMCVCVSAFASEPQCRPGCICYEEEDVAATKAEPTQAVDKIFEAVEQQPSFSGGSGTLSSWLAANLRYPQKAQEKKIEGRVIVQFVVEKDGSITDPIVARGVDEELDAEAIRVVRKMPKWQPGRNNGVPVRSRFTLPVNFRLPH